jgi:hypothetical protein
MRFDTLEWLIWALGRVFVPRKSCLSFPSGGFTPQFPAHPVREELLAGGKARKTPFFSVFPAE